MMAAATLLFPVVGLLASTTPPPPPVRVDVIAVPTATELPVPPNFVGFSTENEPLGLKDVLNAGFAQAFQNLYATTAGAHPGPVLRVGGNSADDWCFHSTADTAPVREGCSGVFNETTLQQQLAFAKLTSKMDINFKYVIDTNLGLTADPSVVATPHVKALGEAGLWPYIKAIEIGNEMDIYASHSTMPDKPHHRNRCVETSLPCSLGGDGLLVRPPGVATDTLGEGINVVETPFALRGRFFIRIRRMKGVR